MALGKYLTKPEYTGIALRAGASLGRMGGREASYASCKSDIVPPMVEPVKASAYNIAPHEADKSKHNSHLHTHCVVKITVILVEYNRLY
jgi:hypothetical protein